MKKIAFIDIMFHWPPIAGPWVDIKGVATQLKRRGFEVELFVPRYLWRGEMEGKLPFKVHQIPFTTFSFNLVNLKKKMREAVEKFDPDYIFLGDGYFLKPYLIEAFSDLEVILRVYAYEIFCPCNRLFIMDKREICESSFILDQKECLKCVKHSVTFENLIRIFFNSRNKRFGWSCRWHEFINALAFLPGYPKRLKENLARADKIIVYNETTKEMVAPYNQKISICPSGVDARRFFPVPKHNPKRREKIILMSGRTDDITKGFSVLQNACDRLRKRRSDFRLIVTSGSTNDFGRNYISSPGWLSQDELPSLYQESDLCVVPSIWLEPFGITAVEAMACGKPVIASKIGGLQHIVDDGKTGFLVPPGDIDALAQKIEILLDAPKMREEMGKEGRKKVEREYDWERVIEKHYLPIFS